MLHEWRAFGKKLLHRSMQREARGGLNLCYDKSFYLLPFDHPQLYVSDMVHLKPAMYETQLPQVIDSQQLEHCRRSQRRFMFELLMPPTDDRLSRAGGKKDFLDRQARPLLRQQTQQALQDAGIEPGVWKVEGLDLHADVERLVQIARRGGREQVGCILLGRGADEARVRAWLTAAAGVPVFIDFAVGRTSFWDAVSGYRTHTLTLVEAAAQIDGHLREWVDIFKAGRQARLAPVK